MNRDEIKKAIVFKIKSASKEDKPNKEVLDAFAAKAEEVVRAYESTIYTNVLKEEIRSFKNELLEKSKLEKFIEKTTFFIPLIISLFIGYIMVDIDNKNPKLEVFNTYQIHLSLIGAILFVWISASLYFVFRE